MKRLLRGRRFLLYSSIFFPLVRSEMTMSAGGHARAQRLSTKAGTAGPRASLCRGTLPLATTLGEEVLTLGS